MRLLPAVLVLALGGTARADEPPPVVRFAPLADVPEPTRWVGATVLQRGRGQATLVHESSLTTFVILPDELGKPWSTGLDLAYGLTDRLTVGVSHSARALGTVDRGGGWCHEGGTHRCRAAYAGTFVDARWLVHDSTPTDDARSPWDLGPPRGTLVVAALARAGILGTDPLLPAVRLGVAVRARRAASRFWLAAEPEVQIALGHRELGNRDTLIAPLWLGVGVGGGAAAWLATGLRGGLVGFGDKYEVPLALGGALRVPRTRARAGLELGFPRLFGPQNTGNVRHAALWLAFSF